MRKTNDEERSIQSCGMMKFKFLIDRGYTLYGTYGVDYTVYDTLGRLFVICIVVCRDFRVTYLTEASHLIWFEMKDGCCGAVQDVGVIVGDTTGAHETIQNLSDCIIFN